VGRLADGWLGSLLTPDEARGAVATINAAADQAGRAVDQDHFGISLAVAFGGIPDALAASIRRRRQLDPRRAPHDADPAALVADGWAGARDLISSFTDAGLSKFVIRPATTPESLEDFIAGFARELMPLQT
jgi:alkanesulfonate monooxygenase SsuD/methylene tetrahydromethanopterin reductase-like flavin-dependent oxidoreductase (luciferase family)